MNRDDLFAILERDSQDSNVEAPVNVVELGEEMGHLAAELDSRIEGSLAAKLAELKKRYDDIRLRRLPEAMANAGMLNDAGNGKFSLRSGATVSLRHSVYASCRKDDREHFHQWLYENEPTAAEALIQPTVHPSTLKGWARERLQNGKELPPMIQSFYETTATLRKR